MSVLIIDVIEGPYSGQRFELPEDKPALLGRNSKDLPLRDATMSRRHAKIGAYKGDWFIRDLGSSNGTYVNGTRVEDIAKLGAGDRVRIGATQLEINVGDEPTRDREAADYVEILDPTHIDVSFHSTTNPNEESIIMAVPEPTEAAVEHLKVIYEMTKMVGAYLDRKTLLDKIMDLVFTHFEPERGAILLRDDDAGELTPVIAKFEKEPEGERADTSLGISRTIIHHVDEKQEGVLTSNAMTDARFSAGDSIQMGGIRSAICVPVAYHGQKFGVIYVDSSIANLTFTGDQLELMTAIGIQAGLALASLHSFKEGVVEERLEQAGEIAHVLANILREANKGEKALEHGIETKQDDALERAGKLIGSSMHRIATLTRNMLVFSPDHKPRKIAVDINDTMISIVRERQPEIDEKKQAVITDMEEDLPTVVGDPDDIRQAIMNLFDNAHEAAEPKRGAVTIGARFDEKAKRIVIRINDNGRGMMPEELKEACVPFRTSKQLTGAGLGLAAAKRIAQRYGGDVKILDTERGKGTTVEMTLRAKRSKSSESSAGEDVDPEWADI
ncbi:MAG: FHA domain-containing protein [Phycisphaera sp.]|nr:FHA domain-containing protein [Phycisphaera sp.]